MPTESDRRSSTPAALAAACALAALAAFASGCATAPRTGEVGTYADVEAEPDCTVPAMEEPPPPVEPACANEVLTAYDGLVIFAPHPDDEALGFGGLVSAYLEQGKPVRAIVVTDGDAYCGACRLWKSSSFRGSPCGAADLSNFATPEVDSFAEVRRAESTAAAAVLGLPAPRFLGYPDTGLAAAWRNLDALEPETPLRRSDFSHCTETCATCGGGYGEGPATELSAATLIESLTAEMAATSERTLFATTHWLDGHPDHAALGRFVHALNSELPQPRAVAYAVIHAHTPKDQPHADCWYPAPQSPQCRCMTEACNLADPARVATIAAYRLRPDWPAALPDDADYGPERQLCLPERLWRGEQALKLRAVRSYRSQLGTLARDGSHPAGLDGVMDCSGYLTSFVRRTEAFVLADPAEVPPHCVPTTAADCAPDDACPPHLTCSTHDGSAACCRSGPLGGGGN